MANHVTNHLIMEIFKRLRAFTLIELLIVITIIGILAVALVPRITGGPAKARDASRKADLQQIATALEFYADDNAGGYPDDVAASNCVANLDLDSYLTTIPSDPNGADGGNCDDGYAYTEVSGGYILGAGLENTSAQGDGIYESTFNIVPGGTAAENLDTNSDLLCDGSCTAPLYVVGR